MNIAHPRHPLRELLLLACVLVCLADPRTVACARDLPDMVDGWTCEGRPLLRKLSAGTTKMPTPLPEQDDYDVLHYDIHLSIDPVSSRLQGVVYITAVPVENGLEEIVLDFTDDMDVILCGRYTPGFQYLPWEHTGGLLRVLLPDEYTPADTLTFLVVYDGHPQPDGLFGFQFIPRSDGRIVAASLSEPWSARSWWPCKDTPTDKATYTVALDVPEEMTAVSQGIARDQQPVNPYRSGAPPPDPARWLPAAKTIATRTFYWEEPLPISTYLFSVAASDYVELTDTYISPVTGDTLDLRHWVYPWLVDTALEDFSRLPDMLAFCETTFGPYPFPGQKYGMALFEWDGAMEHPTVTTYSSQFLTGDHWFDTVILHELAHQWFGDLITPEDWTQIWLNEGFATYAEALWQEHEQGPAALKWFMAARSVTTWWTDPLVRSPDEDDPWYYFKNMVYYKGAWVLHMLRHLLGDTTFFAALKAYTASPALAYGTADSRDFQAVCEKVSRKDLQWFFHQWLYRSTNPHLEVNWWNDDGPSGSAVVLHFRQVQGPDPLDGDAPYILPLDVQLQTAVGDTIVQITITALEQEFTLPVSSPVQAVVLDPGGWLLFDADMVAATVAPAAGVLALLPPTPNPFTGSGLIRWRVPDPAATDRVTIYDARGRRIRSFPPLGTGTSLRALPWDGTDDTGRPCPAGVYLYRIESLGGPGGGHRAAAGKIVLGR